MDIVYLWLTGIAAIAVASLTITTMAAHWVAERWTIHLLQRPLKPRTRPCPACACDVCGGEGRVPAP
jgi:hypothetical protein